MKFSPACCRTVDKYRLGVFNVLYCLICECFECVFVFAFWSVLSVFCIIIAS